MLIFNARECLAKEAESLERAKQMDDADLKHLHETIARQWRLFAETIEPGRLKTQAGDCAETKTSTGNRKAAGRRQSKRKVTPTAGNATRLRQPSRRHSF